MFIQKDFNENDSRAKEKLVELFKSDKQYCSCDLIEPKNKYTVDFYVYQKGNHIANIEVEVKNAWKGYDFIYNDIQILARKRKFWTSSEYNLGKPTSFVLFNSDLSNHLVIMSDDMVKVFQNTNTRNYGTEKTRNDSFFIADKSIARFSYFG